MGFSAPLAAWLRGSLRDWAEALLAPERLKREGYFAAETVRGAWTDVLRGRGSVTATWAALMFQSWLDARAAGFPLSRGGKEDRTLTKRGYPQKVTRALHRRHRGSDSTGYAEDWE